jgi:polyisoprenoid-binding protein YceI
MRLDPVSDLKGMPMQFVRPIAIAALALASASSCTAVKVATHTTSADPIDAPAGAYQLDPHHWSVTFDVDHFGYSRFVMRFDRMSADLDFHPEDPARSKVTARIEAASLDTNDSELDDLVKGPELLEAERFPEITFVSRDLRATGKNSGEMTGDLTIHGETRPVTLAVTFNGGAPNPLTGRHTLGFSATGHFSRGAFGLMSWYPAVGREIQLRIEAEFENRPG